ncbi:luciferase family oxidoreductase group 1 [Bosea sp. BE125]|nr:luciferase family oxidoreductase group 1 [Bosea sp. BE125]
MAKKAEEAGFARFWVAEHHNAQALASSSPEILISFLLAHTSRIRIGSGGVMLQHYSSYKVAENFNLLASLAPGRVDLGIGKAPGGMPLSTQALQGAHDPARKPSFETQLADLNSFLRHNSTREAGPDEFGGQLAAYPTPTTPPERFLLGASVDSARLAARLGWNFVYAGHINGDAAAIAAAVTAYREAGGPSVLLATNIVIAETEAEAATLGGEIRRFRIDIENGPGVNVGSREQALEYARQIGATQYRIEERTPLLVRGTPACVGAELDRLHRTFGIDEFILECPETDGSRRLKTIELLAAANFALAA